MTKHYVLNAEPAEYTLDADHITDWQFTPHEVRRAADDIDVEITIRPWMPVHSSPRSFTVKELRRRHLVHYRKCLDGTLFDAEPDAIHVNETAPAPVIVRPPGFGLRDLIGLFVTRKFRETLALTHADALELYYEQLQQGPAWKAHTRRLVVYVEIARCCFAGTLFALLKSLFQIKIKGGNASE